MANHGNDLHSSRAEEPAQVSHPEAVEVPEPPNENVGLLLKAAREKAGLQVRDVSDALNIRYVYIQALEAGEYEKLPGRAYATGFLRTYAQYLALDVGEILRRFKEEEAGAETEAQLVFPTPVPEGKVPGAALIIVSILFLGLVAYGARYYFSEEEPAVADLVPPVPERLQELVEQDGGTSPPEQSAERPATTIITSPVFVLPKPGEEDGSRLVEPAETAAAMPEPAAHDRPTEPEAQAGAGLDSEDRGAAPASEPAVTSPEPQLDSDPGAGAEPVPLAVEQSAPPQAAAAEVAAPRPRVSDTPDEGTEPQSTENGPMALLLPTTPLSEPDPAMIEGGAAPGGQVAAIPEAPAPAARPAAAASVPVSAAPEPASIPAAPATEGPSQPVEEQAPRVYGVDNADARIVLRVTQDSWVQVRDDQDSLLLTRLLRAGDSYRVPNRSGLTMLTGNAGGLEIEVDGTSLGTLGPIGKVRRDVALDPDRLIKSSNLPR